MKILDLKGGLLTLIQRYLLKINRYVDPSNFKTSSCVQVIKHFKSLLLVTFSIVDLFIELDQTLRFNYSSCPTKIKHNQLLIMDYHE